MTQGRCLCGAVQFSTQGPPRFICHCHCESCRRQTGSIPATFVGFADHQVEYPAAQPSEFESSPGVFRGFCTRCGSAIHYRPVEDREIHLYLGVFDDPARYRTNGHTFYNEHIEGYEFSDNLPRFGPSGKQPIAWGREATRNLLFLCTGNSARSIMAEAIANRRTLGGIRAFSAGSRPSATVDAAAIAELERRDYATDHLHSKSWDLFVGADAPQLEWVITLCDRAAAENCPAFAGDYERDHWSIPDPAGNPAACAEVFQSLDERITAFMRFRASAAHRGT